MAKSQKFRIGPDPISPDDAARWLEAQMPYPNLADNEEVAERALQFVTEKVRRWEQQTQEIRDKWETLDFMLRGETLSTLGNGDSDIHVPVLYTVVETLVPLVVDSIVSLNPWFSVQGRDRGDRHRAKKIQAWLLYQADQTRLLERLEEIARTFIVYQFVACKSWWEVRHRRQTTRDVEKAIKNGLPEYTITPKEEDVLVYEGNRFKIVDPYLFFCDNRETDVQDMQFVGDISFVSEEELIRLGKQGIYKNVDKVIERIRERGENHYTALTARSSLAQRSLSSSHLFGGDEHRGKGQPGRLEVAECWCTWRPTEDDDFDEWVLTVCNDIVIRAQKNPYDDKHRPYAVARAAKEPFDFLNVGVLDHGIRLNREVDDHRNLARKSHQLALSPHVFLGPDADAPDNLWDVEPGQVFRTNNPPTFGKVPSTVAEMIPFEQVLRRDIEHATGSFGAFEGGTESNTATEYERKVQLRNLRNRRLVYAFADAPVQLLRHFFANTAQFVTQRKTFRVLGTDAKDLGIDYEISPEDFTDPVDIIVTGPRRLQSYGLRATQVMSFLQQVAPFVPMLTQNGQLNVPGLVAEVWESIVGYRLGEDVLEVPKAADDACDPLDENMALSTGGSADVHPLDDDAYHIATHDELQKWAQSTGRMDLVERIEMHIQAHREQAMRKYARARAASQESQGPFQSGNTLGSRHAPQDGRTYQRSPDLMGDVSRQTPPGETPGPPRAGAMGAPDREPSVPQTQNR